MYASAGWCRPRYTASYPDRYPEGKETCGDFAARGPIDCINTPARINSSWRNTKRSERSAAIAFTAERSHAIDLAAVLRAAGYRASLSPVQHRNERRKLIAKFKNGEIDVITNVAVVSGEQILPIATWE